MVFLGNEEECGLCKGEPDVKIVAIITPISKRSEVAMSDLDKEATSYACLECLEQSANFLGGGHIAKLCQ